MSCLLFEAIKRGLVCVCVCVREREREREKERERTCRLCPPPPPLILVALMAFQHLLPAALYRPLTCWQLDSNTGSIHRLVPLLFLLHQLSFFSHTLHRPFIPHALTLNYFHTKSVYSLQKPLELARKGLVGWTHSLLQVRPTFSSVLIIRNVMQQLYLTLGAGNEYQFRSGFYVALLHIFVGFYLWKSYSVFENVIRVL